MSYPPNGDIDIQLQNGFGAVLASSSTSDDSELIMEVLDAGTYYLRVLGMDWAAAIATTCWHLRPIRPAVWASKLGSSHRRSSCPVAVSGSVGRPEAR